MIEVAARLLLAAVLLTAAGLKVARPRAAREGLRTFGLRSERTQGALLAVLVALEAGLAAGIAGGSDLAARLAAAVLGGFATGLAWALLSGRAGRPCACFGARSRVTPAALARTAGLAVACALVPLLPEGELGTDEWLGLGLAFALAGVAGLGVSVAALAREVGMLRMALGPQAALEIPHEGPELGGRSAVIDRFPPGRELALAVFSSEGCHLCQALAPAVDALGDHPAVSLRVFDEVRDADVWQALDVPGSPFAVALGPEGTVLAKGTFNNLAQLEGVLAAAERRAAAAHA